MILLLMMMIMMMMVLMMMLMMQMMMMIMIPSIFIGGGDQHDTIADVNDIPLPRLAMNVQIKIYLQYLTNNIRRNPCLGVDICYLKYD